MRKVWLFFLFVLSCIYSCSAENDWESLSPRGGDSLSVIIREELHVLILGNSLSRDAFSYAPAVINNVCPNVDVDMRVLYVNGKPLSTHWGFISRKESGFVLDYYSSSEGKWKGEYAVNADDVLMSQNWDVIVLQEGSANARSLSTTLPSVENIVNYIRLYQQKSKIAYILIPSLAGRKDSLGVKLSDETWEKNASTAKDIQESGLVDYVIPCGTAIQNARHTLLDKYGDYGHLSFDGRHLQEGIPCLTDAFAAAQSIMDIMGYAASVSTCNLAITQRFVEYINVMGRHGSVIEGTTADYGLSKMCALKAVQNPYCISAIDE